MLSLVPEAKYWHRLWSLRFAILSALYSAAAGAWVLLPPDWQPSLSEGWKWALASIGVLIPGLAAVSRILKQESLDGSGDSGK